MRAVERILWAIFYELPNENIILKSLSETMPETVSEAEPLLFPSILGRDRERSGDNFGD